MADIDEAGGNARTPATLAEFRLDASALPAFDKVAGPGPLPDPSSASRKQLSGELHESDAWPGSQFMLVRYRIVSR
ncbi:hypothetical protein MesoLjLb_09900 [Mesorhizobium sp. L-8-3]|nr:hypothetical protein MesoLjLb_09900 [Mesorhizobium sp. L-8-3]